MPIPERGREILYLTQSDVVAVHLQARELLDLVRVALTEHGLGQFEMPAKIGLHPEPNSLMHAMPGWVPAAGACGIKWAECFPENHRFGLPQTSGLFILNCPESGFPLCVMDAIWITAKRTPAVSALACEHLAPAAVEQAGVLGAGVQGREHILLLPEVLPSLERIHITDRFDEATDRTVAELQPRLPDVELVPCRSVEDVVRGSRVVVSATAILAEPDPQVRDSWVEPDSLILPVDFDSFWEWETFTRADKVLVDSPDEMNYFMSVGYLPNGLPELYAELGEVVAGRKAGRERDDELIIDMNIGMGVEDVVVGRELYQRACQRGIGTVLPL